MINDIDNLDIVKRIGKGTFSNVYLCRQDKIDVFEEYNEEYFVVKEINTNILVNKYLQKHVQKDVAYRTVDVELTPYQKRNLQTDRDEYYYKRIGEIVDSEIEVLKLFDNERIVRFYSYNQQNGMYYLCMEYCGGGDVLEYMKHRKQKVSSKFITEFIKQITESIALVHNKHLIHRDLKLTNILINNKDEEKLEFKLADFGFACYDLADIQNEDDINLNDIIARKYFKLCGTPYYMAPELLLNMDLFKRNSLRFYSKAVDMWSYGVCIYELAYKKHPFETEFESIEVLEALYKSSDAQDRINATLANTQGGDRLVRSVLARLLVIDPIKRADVTEITEMVNNIPSIIDSWEDINETCSAIDNLNVDMGFLKWLMNKS